MFVGLIRVKVNINTPISSLKDKRRVIKSLKDKLRHSFNISVNEIGCHREYYKSEIGISLVSHDRRHLDSTLDKVMNYFEDNTKVSIEGIEREII